jgi:hypothetical protein
MLDGLVVHMCKLLQQLYRRDTVALQTRQEASRRARVAQLSIPTVAVVVAMVRRDRDAPNKFSARVKYR